MKKLAVLLTAIMTMSSVPAFASEHISVLVDGKQVIFDQQPMIKEDRTLVPLRGIFEAMGASVTWIDETKTVFAEKRMTYVSLQIGRKTLQKDNKEIALDVPAQIINERTMVPARAVAEAFDADVKWDADTKTVTINSQQKGQHQIIDKLLLSEVKADDGTILIENKFFYPQIENPTNDSVLAMLNKTFYDTAVANTTQFEKENKKTASEHYAMSKKDNLSFAPYSSGQKFDITYDKKNLFSMVTSSYEYTGGAHPNSVQTSTTYDLKTGKKVMLSELFTETQKDMDETLIKSFSALIDAKPDAFFPDAKATLKEHLSEVGYYLTDSGVAFYLNPYLISPYSSGVVGFTVERNN